MAFRPPAALIHQDKELAALQRISLVFAHPPTPDISVDAIAEGVQGQHRPEKPLSMPFSGGGRGGEMVP